MLSLDDPRWSDLQHAYGPAKDIPPLLRELARLPTCKWNEEPWFTLWSALAHQGSVFTASFAAVPHVVAAIAIDPTRAASCYFHFPAWVEVCRLRKGIVVPVELAPAYREALSQLPSLVAAAASRDWDADFLACALSAIAAAKGFPSVAEAVIELTPAVATEFIEWVSKK